MIAQWFLVSWYFGALVSCFGVVFGVSVCVWVVGRLWFCFGLSLWRWGGGLVAAAFSFVVWFVFAYCLVFWFYCLLT